MAKKKTAKKTTVTQKVNKSQAIRDYDKAHPNVAASIVAADLAKQGIKIRTQLVYKVRAKTVKKKSVRKPRKATTSQRVATTKPTSLDSSALETAAKFVKQSGGVEQARQALNAVERIAKALG